jgi:hypothetical protein
MKKQILSGVCVTSMLLMVGAILFPVFATARVKDNRNHPALKARAKRIDSLSQTLSDQVNAKDWVAANATLKQLKNLAGPSVELAFTEGTILIGQGKSMKGLKRQEQAAWVGNRPYWHSPYVYIKLARSAKGNGLPELAARSYRQAGQLMDQNPGIVPADQGKRLHLEASQAL